VPVVPVVPVAPVVAVVAVVALLAAVARLVVGDEVEVDVEVVPRALFKTANSDCSFDSVTSICSNSLVRSVCWLAKFACRLEICVFRPWLVFVWSAISEAMVPLLSRPIW
jgi:hypothetical protein